MRLLTIALALGLMGPGCSENKKPTAPVVAKEKKGLSRAPVRKAVVKDSTGLPTSRPASRPTSRPTGKVPPGHPSANTAASQPATGGSGGSLKGTITLAKAQQSKAKAGSTLFIIVRRDAGEGKKGMMLAAKKIPVVGPKTFPLTYNVTSKDVMMAGTPLAGTVRVSARIDQDGDAISKQPGDVVGRNKTAVKIGAKSVDFTLDSAL